MASCTFCAKPSTELVHIEPNQSLGPSSPSPRLVRPQVRPDAKFDAMPSKVDSLSKQEFQRELSIGD